MLVDLNNYLPSQQQQAQLDLLLNLLREAKKQAIEIIVTGGYGLDALYGKLTRNHRDFDLFVHFSDKDRFTNLLNNLGFISTEKLIGKVKKEEFCSAKFPNFSVEFGIIENALDLLSPQQKSKVSQGYSLGSLNNNPVPTPNLTGYKIIIDLNNHLAVQNGEREYPHKDWMETMIAELEKKYT